MKKWVSFLAIVSLVAVSTILIYKEALAKPMLCDTIVLSDEDCAPTLVCNSQAFQECKEECGGLRKCQGYEVLYAYCIGDTCHILYRIWCSDGSYFGFVCDEDHSPMCAQR